MLHAQWVGLASKDRLASGARSRCRSDARHLAVVTAHRHTCATSRRRYASLRNVSERRSRQVYRCGAEVGGVLTSPRWTRARVRRFDRDGDLDLLITTNNVPSIFIATINCRTGMRSARLTKSTGTHCARVRIFHGESSQSRLSKALDYLSQSALPLTFAWKTRQIDRW